LCFGEYAPTSDIRWVPVDLSVQEFGRMAVVMVGVAVALTRGVPVGPPAVRDLMLRTDTSNTPSSRNGP